MSDGKRKAKVERAAKDPRRPGEGCKAEPGTYEIVVDRARCEGKRDCIDVCPHDVFELGKLTTDEHRALPFLARLKTSAHGLKTVRTPNLDACRACGLCVVACPEKALQLVRRGG